MPTTVSNVNPTAEEKLPAVMLLAATALEARALRRELPDATIVTAGVALAKVRAPIGETVVSCGLAGALRDDLPTGTLLLPRVVRRPDGQMLHCDDALVDAFAASARMLGIEPVFDPLLTASEIVHGAARGLWAAQGYAGVDMETGRIDAPRVAAVRVVLDTPRCELSPDWQHPLSAMLKPQNWPQAVWMARHAPGAARLAARVVAQVIGPRLRITRPW